MNNLANGPGVRFFKVRIAIAYCVAGILTGRTFNPARRELNWATEFGKMPTNFPVAISVVVN